MRASQSVSACLEEGLAAHDLSHTQLGVLEALWHVGPSCQKDLARRVLRSPANMTAVIDSLEKRRLVRRERGGRDRRLTTVLLTEEGEATVARVFPGHVRGIEAALGALSPAEQEELGRLCRKLGPSAEQGKGAATSRAGSARRKEDS